MDKGKLKPYKTMRRLPTAAALCIVFSLFGGQTANAAEPAGETSKHPHESIFGDRLKPLDKSSFTWGADVGASLDVNGYDITTFDLDLFVGYKDPLFKTLGVGTGIRRDFHTGNHFIPLYGILRTSFSRQPKICFMNLKAGYSFNTLRDGDTYGGFMLDAGVGFNLYVSQSVKTHIIVSYGFTHLNKSQSTMVDKEVNHIDQVQILFGVNF